jgi:hypothetical protein
MQKLASSHRFPRVLDLPHDLTHNIFSKLGFNGKINSGLVCKQWDQLLKAGTDAFRHWVVDYDVNTVVFKAARPNAWAVANQLDIIIKRWGTSLPFVMGERYMFPGITGLANYLNVQFVPDAHDADL